MTTSCCSPDADVTWTVPSANDVVWVAGRLNIAITGVLNEIDAPPAIQAALARVVLRAASAPATATQLGAAAGVDTETATRIVEEAIRSVLIRADAETSHAVLPSAVRRWQQLRRARAYVDYGAATVFDDDAARMRDVLRTEAEPPLEPAPGTVTHELPHPALTEPATPRAVVGNLLYWTCGSLRSATFLNILTVQLKAVPSFGCRHPFDAVLGVPPNSGTGLRPGKYVYLPSTHRLSLVETTAPATHLLEFHPVLERLWWRYRYSYAYEMALLDIGHVRAAIRLHASHLGVRVTDRQAVSDQDDRLSGPWQVFELDITGGSRHDGT